MPFKSVELEVTKVKISRSLLIYKAFVLSLRLDVRLFDVQMIDVDASLNIGPAKNHEENMGKKCSVTFRQSVKQFSISVQKKSHFFILLS